MSLGISDRKEKMKAGQVRRDTKPRRANDNHEKSDVLIFKTNKLKYSKVLKAMRSDAKFVYLGAVVHSITRTGKMVLDLKRDETHKDAVYKCLAEAVLGEGAEVRALTAEAALKGARPRMRKSLPQHSGNSERCRWSS